jgi:uncharacterized protein (TIGR03435 family)
MFQSLIEEQFHLKVQWVNRPVTAYTLVAASPHLKPADPKARTRCQERPGPDGEDPRIANPVLNRLLTCENVSMAQFGVLLGAMALDYIYYPVQDATGLTGGWNFTLSYSSFDQVMPGQVSSGAPGLDGAATSDDPNGAVSLFDAVKRELGLRLDKEKRDEKVLVIDHVDEQPSED